jgi:hypothetical protein
MMRTIGDWNEKGCRRSIGIYKRKIIIHQPAETSFVTAM